MSTMISTMVIVGAMGIIVCAVCLYAIATTLMDIRDLMEKKYEQHKHE